MGLAWPCRPLVLLALMMAVTAAPFLDADSGGDNSPWPAAACPVPCRCQGRLLNCSQTALASVPQTTRGPTVSVLDFTGNTISSIDTRMWKEYPWAEYLVLQDNALKSVGRHSLEGLLLLKHLDLSCNKILSIEEHAFEPLPFLQLINFRGNLITHIQNGTFQAWHGMQFLQKLILSHNPLSVIDDTSFFDLPSVKYLDLGATQVTLQTFHTLLLTTVHLETLKLPSDLACCLCATKDTIETLCRTVKLRCENLCSANTPQCAHTDSLEEIRAEIKKVLKSRKLNNTVVLNLKPKEPFLGGHETITLSVLLNVTSSDADLTSKSNSLFPQHLLQQGGKRNKELMLMLHGIQHMDWSSASDMKKLYFLAKVLEAELEKKMSKAKNITTAKNIPPLPLMLALQSRAVRRAPAEGQDGTLAAAAGRQVQRNADLQRSPLNLWEVSERLNPADTFFRRLSMSGPSSKHPLSYSPAEASHLSRSFKNQNYPEVMEQAKNPPEMEDGEDDKEALPPSHSYVWAYKRKDQEESPCQRSDQLFFRPDHEESAEKLPTPSPTKPQQRLNSLGQFFYNLLVTRSHPVAVSAVENKPKDITSSPGGHSVGTQPMDKTHRKHPQEEEFHVPSKPSSSGSPAAKLAKEDFFETKLRHQLRLLVPDTAVRVFVVQAARALHSHCDLPAAQPACAKMVSKLGLLMKVLSDKQGGKGASALAGRCFLEANGTARPKAAGRKLTGKKKSEFARDNGLLIAISASLAIILFLMLICLIEVCSQKSAAASQAQGTSKSRLRRFFQRFLPERRSRNTRDAVKEGPPGSDPSGNKPPWLRDMYQPLDSQRKRSLAQKLYDEESSDEEEIFNKAELK